MVKLFYPLFFLLLFARVSFAQENKLLTLPESYTMAEKNYPVTRQSALIAQTAAINTDNLSKGFLPQVTLSAQATYQSDVTKISIPLPGFTIDPLSKDQYKFITDVNQLVYDGGVIRKQKEMQGLNAGVEEQKVQVELYQLKNRINQLFLGVLYLDEQLKQVELIKADLFTGIKKVEAQVKNGVAFRSNLSTLKAELLKTDQRAIELKSSRKGLLETLGLFLGREITEDTKLERPARIGFSVTNTVERPEMKLFRAQSALIQHQTNLIKARNLPKTSLFVQTGYGRPGLNLLQNGFDLFYIGGVRINWSLGNLYTMKKDKEMVNVNKNLVEVQKETFLLATNTQLKQQESEVNKLEKLLSADTAIIELRQQVKEAAKAQLENGVITANDYLREVNAEDQARQSLITHELQLLQARITYQTILGK